MGPRQASWFARLDADGENLLGALDRLARASRRARSRRAPGRRRRALLVGARPLRHRPAGTDQRARRPGRGRAKAGDTAPDPARGKALVRAGGLALYLCDLDAAGPPIDESLAIYQALGDKKGVARAFAARATLAAYRGDLDESRQFGLSSLEIYREIGEPRGIAATLHNLGYLALLQGAWAEAAPLYAEAIALSSVGSRRPGGHGPDPGGPGRRHPWARARGGARGPSWPRRSSWSRSWRPSARGPTPSTRRPGWPRAAGEPARAARYLACRTGASRGDRLAR